MTKRSAFFDCMRALAMFNVLLVHCFYWGNLFTGATGMIVKSLFLIEMPLLFFATGALNEKYAFIKFRDYFSFLKKRLVSLFVPYYIYAAICFAMSFAFYVFKKDIPGFFAILKILCTWLFPMANTICPFPYLTWALWFIPVYSFSIILFPFILKILQNIIGRILYFSLTIVIIVIMSYIHTQNTYFQILQEIVFYTLFAVLGALYYRYKDSFNNGSGRFASVAVACAVLIGAIIVVFKGTLDMQENKFPPNIVFLLYALMILCLLRVCNPLLLVLYKKMKNIKLFALVWNVFSKKSMIVFLYQSLVFAVIFQITEMSYFNGVPTAAKFVIDYVCAVIGCFIIAVIYSKVVEMVKRSANRIKTNSLQ